MPAFLSRIPVGKGTGKPRTCTPDFRSTKPVATFGIYRGELVADIEVLRSVEDIDGVEYRKWRSGVKHDAAKVMEFKPDGNGWVNGYGERHCLESTYLFPLLKSSDLANDRLQPSKHVLLTQRQVTDDTSCIRLRAPQNVALPACAWRRP